MVLIRRLLTIGSVRAYARSTHETIATPHHAVPTRARRAPSALRVLRRRPHSADRTRWRRHQRRFEEGAFGKLFDSIANLNR